MMFTAFLGIGSNLGDKPGHIRAGLQKIAEKAGRLKNVSAVYETEPWGVSGQDTYYNLVAEIETPLFPLQLLHALQQTEHECGRERKERWGSRTLDIDLLFFEDYHFSMDDLTVPHPRLAERNFVLYPMAEIAPGLVHPAYGLTLSRLKEISPDTGWIKPLNLPADADTACS
ncbi:2-amino-4-hydroxy-6-hydroxymethyldihydropteridine diphosphokinase [Leadbetterella sp. DM7]|uniref:2-amino-4-hydroxy-6- hydroxymethyldihydropteridine diphosphokinase n=1 Tax=Leadbetterella sp. DM7 TaxID=3235085 RepID=UPI00349EC309